ncbi:hypothetical protein N7475_007897 [Penicillium sp. IBT 31633x]|nr:hypothetical protein N7475_007897 [Penicillium sp. IBT 31633x]
MINFPSNHIGQETLRPRTSLVQAFCAAFPAMLTWQEIFTLAYWFKKNSQRRNASHLTPPTPEMNADHEG